MGPMYSKTNGNRRWKRAARASSTVVATLTGLTMASLAAAAPELQLDKLRLPAGYSIEVYANGVPGARSMALSPEGIVFVGTRQGAGQVYAVVDQDGDFRADRVHILAENLNMPNGVAWRDGSLFVAEVNRILRFDDIAQQLESPPEPVVVNDSFPSDRHHGWKFIRFGPDGRLYVPVGAPCNVCAVESPYASILSMEADGSDLQSYAQGVRNTVGFDWHPVTGELWFTDNGRDMMGNDIPPDELNHAPHAGLHFGFPHCHGSGIEDDKFGDSGECDDIELPVLDLAPHVAAVGMRFYTGEQFPEDVRGQILIAEHGSWNRTEPIGFRLSVVRLGGDGPTYETLIDGWLQGKKAWGRPVDLVQLPDGSILLSDDVQGVIYRVSYSE